MSSNFYLDNEDLRFQLERAFDWSEIVSLYERGYSDPEGFKDEKEARELYTDILTNVGKYVATEVAPRAMRLDRKEPTLKQGEVILPAEMQEIFDGFKDMGLYGLNLPRELGGLNAPMAMYFATAELISRGDMSILGHYGFHGGIAMSLLAYSIEEGSVEQENGIIYKTRFDRAISEIARGEAFGCMVLTEPDAGSDLSAIRTRGIQGPDGRWRLTGQKIFITSGHGQHQLVLAKTESSDNGLKDLSLFLVPRVIQRDGQRVLNVQVERLEEKLGIHGSVTCTLAYDESEAELIGQRGQGFELMLLLMNNARLGVSFEAIGLMEHAYRLAAEYAAQRRSMGQTLDRHEMIADYLDRMDADIRGLRALAFEAVWAQELATRLSVKLRLDPPATQDEQAALKRRLAVAKKRARDLTPLLKYQGAEKAVQIARTALQIHGGVGYTTDCEIEKLVRDSLVLPIYEGTSQIQALMALKDRLQGAIRDPGGFLRQAGKARFTSLSARDPLERRLARLQTYQYGALQHILTRIARDKWHRISERRLTEWASAFLKEWDPRRDFACGLLHAERLTCILAEVEIAGVLVKQARRFPERRELAERYLEQAGPVVWRMHEEILHTGERLLGRLARPENETRAQSA